MGKWSLLLLICYWISASNFFSGDKELASNLSEHPPHRRCKSQALPFSKGKPSSATAANLLAGLQGPPATRATSDLCYEHKLRTKTLYLSKASSQSLLNPHMLFPSFLLSPLKLSLVVFPIEVVLIWKMSPQASGKTLMYITIARLANQIGKPRLASQFLDGTKTSSYRLFCSPRC